MAIEIDSRSLRASLRRMERELKRPSKLYANLGRYWRDYVRQTIAQGGRKRPYAPLSKWTRRRTGRRKPLITLRKQIRARWDGSAAEIYFAQVSSAWHIDQHHTGYTSPAVVNKRMVIRSKSGGVVAAFFSRKAAVTPAREVWPTKSEVTAGTVPVFKKFVDTAARKNWR